MTDVLIEEMLTGEQRRMAQSRPTYLVRAADVPCRLCRGLAGDMLPVCPRCDGRGVVTVTRIEPA